MDGAFARYMQEVDPEPRRPPNMFVVHYCECAVLFTTREQANAYAEWLRHFNPPSDRHWPTVKEHPVDLPLDEWLGIHVKMARDGAVVLTTEFPVVYTDPPKINNYGELVTDVRTQSIPTAIDITNKLRVSLIEKDIPWVEGPVPELI